MKSYKIWHLGGWNRNLGDAVIKASIKENFQKISQRPLNFVHIDYQKTKLTNQLIETMNNSADLLLVGGGGAVFNRPNDNSVSGWQFNIDFNDLKKIKIPIAIYGIGFNQFKYDFNGFKKGTFEHLIETQKVASHFSCRNTGSKNELVSRGLDFTKIDVIPDSGSFLKPEKIKIPGINPFKYKLGVNWVMDRPEKTFPYNYKKNKEKFIKIMLETFKLLVKECNTQIIQIEHIKGLDDEITKLFSSVLGDDFISIQDKIPEMFPPNDINAKYLVDIYSQMNLILGMRGHSNIIPFGTLTRFIPISSHNKNRFFLQEIERENNLIQLEDLLKNDVETSAKDIIKKIEKVLMNENFDNYNSWNIDMLNKKKKIFETSIKDVLSLINKGDF